MESVERDLVIDRPRRCVGFSSFGFVLLSPVYSTFLLPFWVEGVLALLALALP